MSDDLREIEVNIAGDTCGTTVKIDGIEVDSSRVRCVTVAHPAGELAVLQLEILLLNNGKLDQPERRVAHVKGKAKVEKIYHALDENGKVVELVLRPRDEA